MHCPGCSRDVPDLIGPGRGLCPDCYGVIAEDLIPSLLADLGHELEAEAEEALGGLALLDAAPGDDDEANQDFIPTFRGHRRF